MKKLLPAIVIFCLLLQACSSQPTPLVVTPTIPTPTPQQTPSATATHPSVPTETATPAPTLDRPTATVENEPTLPATYGKYLKVTVGEIFDFDWSADSTQLYIYNSGILEKFDVIKGEKKRIAIADLPVTPDFISWPGYVKRHSKAEDTEFSPSLNNIVYQIRYGTPYQPPAGSSDWRGGGTAHLWVVDKDNLHLTRVGELEDCGVDFLWSRDETMLVVISNFIAPCYSHGWLANIQEQTVQPLLVRSEHSSRVDFYGFSPDNQRLLYKENGNLYLIHVNTLEAEQLETGQPGMGQSFWLQNDRLLVSYTSGHSPVWALYHLTNKSLTKLVDIQDIPVSQDLMIVYPEVSPDSQWLAFYTAKDISDEDRTLWLVQIPPE